MRLLGGKPGDRSLGLPGNLVGYMPQSTRLDMMIIKMVKMVLKMALYMPQSTRLLMTRMVKMMLTMNCLQPVHGVHNLRNVLLFWKASPHDQGSGGYNIEIECSVYHQSILG